MEVSDPDPAGSGSATLMGILALMRFTKLVSFYVKNLQFLYDFSFLCKMMKNPIVSITD
jgi:hypothetical protein